MREEPTRLAGIRAWLRRYRLVCGAFSLVILLGLPTLIVPLYTDQAVFALNARAILDGRFPYRDVWDVKSPGIYFAYALAFLSLGQHMVSVRILDLANTALAMGAIYLLGRRLFSKRAGVIAGCLYGVTYLTRAGFDGLGQTESFLALPVVIAVLIYRPEGRRRNLFLSGLLLGVAFSIKPSAVFYAAALPAVEAMFAKERRLGLATKRLSIAGAGFLLMPAVFAVYLAAGGALGDFIDIQRLHVAPYASLHWSPPGESYIRFGARVTHEYLTDNLFLAVPAVAALFVALAGQRRRETALVATLAVASLLGVWSQGKFFPYHWLAMVFPLSLLAGFAIDQVVSFYGARSGVLQRWAAYGLAGASLVLLTPSLLSNPYEQYRHFLGYATGKVTQADNEGQWGPFLRLDREVLDYIRANGGGDPSFFIWGNWPVVYWWADQPLTTRFVYDTALSADWSPATWRDELVADLAEKRPHFIAVSAGDPQPWLRGNSKDAAELISDYPGLAELLATSYEGKWANDLFRIYERK